MMKDKRNKRDNKRNEIQYEILKKDFLIINGIVGMVVASVLVFMILQRLDILPSFPCGVHEILRVYCPGCGGTRAVFAVLKGQFLKSFYYNPAVPLGALLVIYYETGVILTLVKKNGKKYYCDNIILLVLYLVIVIAFSVVRNYLLVECGIDMLKDFQ